MKKRPDMKLTDWTGIVGLMGMVLVVNPMLSCSCEW